MTSSSESPSAGEPADQNELLTCPATDCGMTWPIGSCRVLMFGEVVCPRCDAIMDVRPEWRVR